MFHLRRSSSPKRMVKISGLMKENDECSQEKQLPVKSSSAKEPALLRMTYGESEDKKWWPPGAPTSTHPTELVLTRLETCPLEPFSSLCKNNVPDYPEGFSFLFFLRVDVGIGGSAQKEPFPMAFYTLASSERVGGLKLDGVQSLVKPLITWLSKHNQGRRFVDHPPLTHACKD